MKAIICDTCGKIVPASKTIEILPLKLIYGTEPIVTIDRDICSPCLNKLVVFFDQSPADIKPDTVKPNVQPGPVKHHTESTVRKQITAIIKPNNRGNHTAITCANCGREFTPKIKTAKCCSHKCSNENWKVNKNSPKPTGKEAQDLLLKKLKSENPIREAKEPNIYREM